MAERLNFLVQHGLYNKVTWVLHPNYSDVFKSRLNRFCQIDFVRALDYSDFVKCYSTSSLIIIDSGGVTEEALILGIPLIVFRLKGSSRKRLDIECWCRQILRI